MEKPKGRALPEVDLLESIKNRNLGQPTFRCLCRARCLLARPEGYAKIAKIAHVARNQRKTVLQRGCGNQAVKFGQRLALLINHFRELSEIAKYVVDGLAALAGLSTPSRNDATLPRLSCRITIYAAGSPPVRPTLQASRFCRLASNRFRCAGFVDPVACPTTTSLVRRRGELQLPNQLGTR